MIGNWELGLSTISHAPLAPCHLLFAMSLLTRSLKYIAIAAGLGALAFLVILFTNRLAEQRQILVEAERVRAQMESLRATDAFLDEQIAYATSDAAVEEWAYQEAHWVREGDHPIVPIAPTESTPVPPPVPTPEPVVYAPWQIWWALFFDELP